MFKLLSYNTCYHLAIVTTLFEVLFGEKVRLPSFPKENIQKIDYGKTSVAERFNLVQNMSSSICTGKWNKNKGPL
jgi:hypothetical protein